ncbi:MAG: anthranilate synthase component I family protein [Thermodesulfovibrionales bacterium]|nr:anthranilate synthase component I family protein [Thermodesulfovibrionales bacterium]
MVLIVNGRWLGKSGDTFYRLRAKKIFFLTDLEELRRLLFRGREYFIIISYDLTSELLDLKIKKSILPPIILIEIGDPEEVLPVISPYFLNLLSLTLEDHAFKERVIKIKELISDGTIYQINLTNRFDFKFNGAPESLFYNFHLNQPVPYSFYLHTGDFYIISGSMELFLEKQEKVIRSKPIKGTASSARELIHSEKDRAENLMITDMMRNDLGMIAEPGSVRVTELFKITEYRTLFQMHSTVEAVTKSDFINIIKATFPPASVTGAPKKKAVEVIECLEPHPRSYYCGCGGMLRSDGDFVLSVLIRTAIGSSDRLSYYTGCGIVWDSEPEKELSELYLKLKAFYRQEIMHSERHYLAARVS